MAETVTPPPGFVLDDELPDGFVLDDEVSPGFVLNMQSTPEGAAAAREQFLNPSPRTQAVQDLASTMGSAMVADPIAGIAGIGASVFSDSPTAGGDAVSAVKGALTVPLGQAGQEAVRTGLENIPPAILDSVIGLAQRHQGFADTAAETFGPAAGAAVKTAPIAALQVLGFKGARQVMSRSNKALMKGGSKVIQEVRDAAPTIDELRAGARAIYRELDDAGALVSGNSFRIMALKARKAMQKAGGRNPKLARSANIMMDDISQAASGGRNVPLEDVLDFRQAVRNLARSPDPKDAAPAAAMLDELDGFIDGIGNKNLVSGNVTQIGDKVRTARELWRRAKRSEVIEEAFDVGSRAASGPEAGIRNRFNAILNSRKERKFFRADEIKAMERVVNGTTGENLLKLAGKFGWSGGRDTSAVLATAGGVLGFQAGGPAGAVVVPLIGSVSRTLANRMVRANAVMANDVIKAGKNAGQIAAAYLKHTPRSRFDPTELAQLLVRPDIPLQGLPRTPVVSEAVLRAAVARLRAAQGAGAVAAGAAGSAATGQP